MDKNLADGAGPKVTGSMKEAIGKVTGDTQLEAEGTAQKAAGDAENVADGAKDSVRDAIRK